MRTHNRRVNDAGFELSRRDNWSTLIKVRNFIKPITLACVILCICATPAPQKSVTRRDLAMAYLRLDNAIREHPPRANDIRRVHKTFDEAMVQIFTRDTAGAIVTMNRLTDSIDRRALPPAIARWTDQRIDAMRVKLQEQLRAIQLPAALEDARKTCLARINLLTNLDAETDSNVFLNSPDTLVAQITRELATLAAGHDPYLQYLDTDYWRPLFTKRGTVPVRIFAPQNKSDVASRALVIALHGAGGDENMFFVGYGAGLIKDLAIKNNFVVISPNTFSMITVPDAFDAIIDTMSRLYNIDTSRVYVVGHSLGAITASGLCSRFPDRVRADVQIAGGGMVAGVPKLPPTLVILAELDPIFPLSRMQSMVSDAKQTGLPIEYRIAKDIGHAGAVDATLDEAVKFLLSH